MSLHNLGVAYRRMQVERDVTGWAARMSYDQTDELMDYITAALQESHQGAATFLTEISASWVPHLKVRRQKGLAAA